MLVKGGPARSGIKRSKKTRRKTDWTCSCGVDHKPYVSRCSVCREHRPEE